MIKKILAAAAFGVASLGAHAATNLLADGDFESTGLSLPTSYCYVQDTGGAAAQCAAVSTGWNAPIYLTSSSGPWGTPSDQSHVGIDLGNVVAAIQGNSTIATNDFSFVVGQEYVISWVSTGRSNNGGIQPYIVSAGGVTDTQTFAPGPNGWQSYSFEFVATSNSPLTFTGTIAEDRTSFIDNVSVTAVPEPTSLMMMGVATLGLLAWRRRTQA